MPLRLPVKKSIISFFSVGLIFLVVLGCDQNSKLEQEIAALPIQIQVDRFDQKFHQSSPDKIPHLKQQYPYLFPQQFADSVWVKRQKDSLQLLLQNAVEKEFPSISEMEISLTNLFKHIHYYFPKAPIPHVIGLINNVDYQSKTIFADSILLISLDTYLGSKHELYEGIPKYIRKQMDIRYLGSHVAEKFIATQMPLPQSRTFLSQLIYHGKIAYLKSLLLPKIAPPDRFGYSIKEWDWAQENQKYIWQYFIEKQLLFSTDPSLVQRFIEPAPFSKFYLEIDNETPGQIGIWLGSEIVKAYKERHPETTTQQLLALPAQALFQQSNYKPKR